MNLIYLSITSIAWFPSNAKQATRGLCAKFLSTRRKEIFKQVHDKRKWCKYGGSGVFSCIALDGNHAECQAICVMEASGGLPRSWTNLSSLKSKSNGRSCGSWYRLVIVLPRYLIRSQDSSKLSSCFLYLVRRYAGLFGLFAVHRSFTTAFTITAVRTLECHITSIQQVLGKKSS